MSIKQQIKSIAIKGINATGVSSKYFGTPKGMMNTADWVKSRGKKFGASYNELSPAKMLEQKPPITLEKEVHKIYRDEYKYEQWPAFVATIPNGRVWGRNCAVITPDDILLKDVSREFGAYGGIMGEKHSVHRRLKLSNCTQVKGNVAVMGTAGCYNYGHWLFDTLPRVYLLQQAGVFDKIDYFVLDYTGLHFQKESIKALGIPEEKIIRANDLWKFHIEAETLFVPALPARLGTYGDWSTPFLRETFLKRKLDKPVRIYLSRRKAPSRRPVNEEEVLAYLESKGFIEFLAEDHTIEETACYFASAEAVVGIHGSGSANFAFLSAGACAVDIIAPKHVDPYFWILCNFNKAQYAYLFGKGERPPEGTDLVALKIDEDLMIDLNDLDILLKKMGIN
jgi:capsular polysaccharide biosynthesis protein